MDLATGTAYAEIIVGNLAPFCEPGFCAVAGSIRRKRPQVGDIDIVLIPRDLEGLKARCRDKCRPLQEGAANLSYETPKGIRIDIYCGRLGTRDLYSVTASNWGSLLLCRTGSQAHNVKVAEAASKRGMKWSPYVGILDAKNGVVASETEEEIFRALGMPFIAPEDRELS